MTSFATGVAGYMGDSILKVFSEFLPKLLAGRFNIQINDTQNNKSKNSNDENKEDK